MSVGYAKIPRWEYHRFDANNIKFTNIPLSLPKKVDPPKEEKEEEKKPEDAGEGF